MARIQIDLPEQFLFETSLTLQIRDINYGGHMSNDAVLSLAHEARLRFLKSADFSELDIGGLGLIMTDAAVMYRAEGHYGDPLQVSIALADANKYGCDILYLFRHAQSGKEIARVKTGIVFFDYHAKKVSPMPDIFKKAFHLEHDAN